MKQPPHSFRHYHLLIHFLSSLSLFNSHLHLGSNEDTHSAALENQSITPVDVSVWKGEKKVFVQKKVASKDSLTVYISDKIFVIENESLNVGDEFQVYHIHSSQLNSKQ